MQNITLELKINLLLLLVWVCLETITCENLTLILNFIWDVKFVFQYVQLRQFPENFVDKLDYFKKLGGSFTEENQDKKEFIKELCIGCGKCSAICPKDNIISLEHPKNELKKLLPECINAGAESIELHAGVSEDELTLDEWQIIKTQTQINLIRFV